MHNGQAGAILKNLFRLLQKIFENHSQSIHWPHYTRPAHIIHLSNLSKPNYATGSFIKTSRLGGSVVAVSLFRYSFFVDERTTN